MIYAKWKLSEDGISGTGPEQVLADRGGRAESAEYVDGDGYRVGYLTGTGDLTGLGTWDFTEVTANEALLFAQKFYHDAVINSEGFISSETPQVFDSAP